MTDIKRTPIYPEYESSGAKTTNFGGWDLPVQFKGIKQEHVNTRERAGLFDVSHMGEIKVEGVKSLEFLQKMTTNDVEKLYPGRAQYTFLCYPDGGTVDDLLLYMTGDKQYLLVVNAANTEKAFEWLRENNTYGSEEIRLADVSAEYVQLALQGPEAKNILQKLTSDPVDEIKFFHFRNLWFPSLDTNALVSRTGYTGEDGFEIYMDYTYGRKLWRLLLENGKDQGLEPVGLGARDTLRFEANLPLYGQELSQSITPVEAGLSFAVKTGKEEDFIGKEVLKDQIENGCERRICGIEMIDKGIPRTGYKVFLHGEEVGYITSGTQSPTLGINVGNALVDREAAKEGTELMVQVRKRMLKGRVVPLPFYKRKK
ncbi:glycine cleavage system aminomethyltransferase GcvT [Virgibacillus xinjiangensis]|uniref:Aminomethyltransferase n=1 Tax=Virgibacillus xinjiangensis TaxID=393090 RepID=A0ABV7CSF4_9BACI